MMKKQQKQKAKELKVDIFGLEVEIIKLRELKEQTEEDKNDLFYYLRQLKELHKKLYNLQKESLGRVEGVVFLFLMEGKRK